MLLHHKRVHEKVKYNCNKCDEAFAFNKQLLKHFEVVHQEDNPYNCEQCDLKFTTQNRLDNHKCLKGNNNTSANRL